MFPHRGAKENGDFKLMASLRKRVQLFIPLILTQSPEVLFQSFSNICQNTVRYCKIYQDKYLDQYYYLLHYYIIVRVGSTKLLKRSGMILFEERINVYFNEATGGRYVPRAVLMDLEPGDGFEKLQLLESKQVAHLQHDVEQHILTFPNAGFSEVSPRISLLTPCLLETSFV